MGEVHKVGVVIGLALAGACGDDGASRIDGGDVIVDASSRDAPLPMDAGPPLQPMVSGRAYGLVIDETTIYFTYRPAANGVSIAKIAKTGGTVTALAMNQSNTWGIAVDADRVYWTGDDGTVKAVAKAGGTPAALATGLGNRVVGISVDADHAYVGLAVSLARVALDGSGATDLGALATPYGVTHDADAVYAVGGPSDAERAVLRVPKGGETPAPLASSQADAFTAAVDADGVFWSTYTLSAGGTIWRVAPTGGTPVSVGTGAGEPRGIALDTTHVYWADYRGRETGGSIRRVAKAGGAVETIASHQALPFSIAVDETHVYWTSYTAGTSGGGVYRLPKP